MASAPKTRRDRLRNLLAASALGLLATVSLAACGQVVETANLGRCTALPNSGGSLCEEIGGEYVFVDSLTRSMRRVTAGQARFIGQADLLLASAPAAKPAGGQGGPRNCLANPGIACSGALNNRISGGRAGGTTAVCSGGQCLSMSR
ncbi:hypothetical protein [Paracraurococcus ruber]|uniref:Lipoprotein n=1 Tax=Paracraurococcus ruber TaxID=77675 RepID=A0ABS1D7F0_9PROT|nr:hypothetical protein [Paracraurococcus ruber]MBK1662491.1 hypothetical protein [Paracraurococcus ruber]TDG30191.1 hypothetical protein E2C05_15215 [Paracraurococcus ruber]